MRFVKNCKKALAYFFLLLSSVICFSDDAAAEKSKKQEIFRIAADTYPPIQSQTLNHFGAIRIVTEAFEAEGIKTEYEWLPWKRALNYGKLGKCDAVALGSRNSEREKFFFFSDPLIIAKTVFFHRKDYPFNWNTINDLKMHRIGTIRGYVYGELFENDRKKTDY